MEHGFDFIVGGSSRHKEIGFICHSIWMGPMLWEFRFLQPVMPLRSLVESQTLSPDLYDRASVQCLSPNSFLVSVTLLKWWCALSHTSSLLQKHLSIVGIPVTLWFHENSGGMP